MFLILDCIPEDIIYMKVLGIIRLLQFPTRDSFDHAVKVILKKGRLYKLDRVCCSTCISVAKKLSFLFILNWLMFDILFLFIDIRLIFTNGTK